MPRSIIKQHFFKQFFFNFLIFIIFAFFYFHSFHINQNCKTPKWYNVIKISQTRCVCILQNYNYKLHFQNLSIYHILHVFIGTLAVESLDVCTTCDPWDNYLYWYQNLEGTPPGLGMPFLDSDTCAKGGLFIFAKVFFPVWCHSWMDDGMNRWMDGWVTWWKKLHEKRPQNLLLYVILSPS